MHRREPGIDLVISIKFSSTNNGATWSNRIAVLTSRHRNAIYFTRRIEELMFSVLVNFVVNSVI